MLRDYDDIRSRISDPIFWWDDNGVPRYCHFRPQQCGVYDVVVALVEVACQACLERFRVAVTFEQAPIRPVSRVTSRLYVPHGAEAPFELLPIVSQ